MQNGNAAEGPDDGGGEYVSSYNGVGSGLGSGSEVQQHRVRHSLGDPPPFLRFSLTFRSLCFTAGYR